MPDHLIKPHGGELKELTVLAQRSEEVKAASCEWPSPRERGVYRGLTVSCVLALEWTTVGRLDSSEILRIRGGLLDLAGALRGSTLSDGLPRALTIVRC